MRLIGLAMVAVSAGYLLAIFAIGDVRYALAVAAAAVAFVIGLAVVILKTPPEADG